MDLAFYPLSCFFCQVLVRHGRMGNKKMFILGDVLLEIHEESLAPLFWNVLLVGF